MDLEGLLAASVPEHDLDWMPELLPGARVETSDFADVEPGSERVVSLMIYDDASPQRLARYPDLEAVVTRSDGYDHLPLDWLEDHGIHGYHLAGYATSSVAQMTLCFLITLLRRFPEAMAVTQGTFRGGEEPPRWDRSRLVGRHLRDATVGIVGTGRIGGQVARLLAAMDVELLGYDIAPDPALADEAGLRYTRSLEELLEASDAVTLHVPLTDATRSLVGADAIGCMRPGAVLVNTCRGPVADPAAVERALREGHLAGYAADILPGEPEPPDLERFRDRPNVLLTPHLGAHNRHTLRQRYRETARVAAAVLDGRPSDASDLRVV